MKAVVTGGAGFIGSHMVDLLLGRDFQVEAVDNLITGRLENLQHHASDKRLTFHELDMCGLEPESPIFEGADYVFHFGGIGDIVPSIDRPMEYMRANVNGTLAVLEAARHAAVRKLVYAASSSCYGSEPGLPTTESATIKPEYPYALSKYLGECAALHWAHVYRLPVNSIRIFNAYGPRTRTSGTYGAVFGVFLAQRLNNEPLTIVGDGTQSRDFVYATDVADAFFRAAETSVSAEVFNLGAGNPQPVKRLAELIGGPTVHIPKRPGEPDCTWADISKIARVLGWQPRVQFEDGVAIMLRNINYWAEAPVWTPQTIEMATKRWFEFVGR